MTEQSTANVSATILDEPHKSAQAANNDQLSDQEAQAVWNEGAAFIDRKASMLSNAADLRCKLNEQIRLHPQELELNRLRVELDQATPRISPTTTYTHQREELEKFFEIVEDISERYADLSANYLPLPVPEQDLLITKRQVVKLMEEAGWEGNVTAFLGQASVDQEIQECQGPDGRKWNARKVYDLGLKRKKLQPKAHRRNQLLANNPWGA